MKNFALEFQLAAAFFIGVAAGQFLESTWALLLGFFALCSVVCAKIGVLTLAHLFILDTPSKDSKKIENPVSNADVVAGEVSPTTVSSQYRESLPNNVFHLKQPKSRS